MIQNGEKMSLKHLFRMTNSHRLRLHHLHRPAPALSSTMMASVLPELSGLRHQQTASSLKMMTFGRIQTGSNGTLQQGKPQIFTLEHQDHLRRMRLKMPLLVVHGDGP